MKKKTKILILDIIGIIFLILGIIAIANSFYEGKPTQILYMCYFGLLFIGIGILTKRSYIIMSQVYILTIPLIIWDIDFIYQLITNMPLFGITDYFFTGGGINIGQLVSLQHLFTIPIAIYAAGIIGVKRRDAWKWSFIQIMLSYIIVSLFSDPTLNVNCVFNPCIHLHLGLPYRITWFLIIFSMTFITSTILNQFPIIRVKKKQPSHPRTVLKKTHNP